jgi:hypothetical protein
MPNPICHFEIGCRDRANTRRFFAELFDWKMEDTGPATYVQTGDDVGGHITALGHEPHNYTIFYIRVGDVKALSGEGQCAWRQNVGGPLTIPTGTFAWFADPEGNTIGLWQDKK